MYMDIHEMSLNHPLYSAFMRPNVPSGAAKSLNGHHFVHAST
jgi:hypothetical protein